MNGKHLTVTSAGNAWVICDSKSRPGFRYYFNTVSGQSVWNLSPEEIEKAEKLTRALPLSEIEKCPEPAMDPPMDPQQSSQQPVTPNMLPMLSTNVNNMSQMPTNFSYMPQMSANFNNMPQLPANFNVMAGPNISGLNPFIWNTATNPMQAQPIIYLVAPPQAGFPMQQFPQNVPAQDISYNNKLNEEDDETPPFPTSVNKVFNRNRLGPSNSNKPDLRQKLIRKRCKSESDSSIHVSSTNHINTERTTIGIHSKNTILGSKKNLQEEQSKFDLSVLDKLKPSNSTLLNWFIVVDTEILLENFQFLNKVTDPDQNCFLVVPEHVMCELEALVQSGTDMPKRRILRFLNEQIESELAFRGDEITNFTNDRSKIYATCQGLAERNNVILLSDDPGLERYNNGHVNIHVFRLNEFKRFLIGEHKNKPTRVTSPTFCIKIHVPNNKHGRDSRPSSSSFFRDQVFKSGVDDFQTGLGASTSRATEKVHPQTPKKKSGPSQAHHLKKPVLENIQTYDSMQEKDILTTQVKLSSNNSSDEVDNRTLSNKTSEPVESETKSQSQTQNQTRKRIILSRTTKKSNDTENIDNQTKYRWRGKNRFSTSKSESKPSEKSYPTEPPVMQEKTITEEPSTIQEIAQVPEISPIREHSLERSSISSYRKTIDRPSVVIEETSTSGIISNSTEVDSINRKYSISSSVKETASVCDDVNFVRHQVVGQSMEDVLRTRRDEWVLRFVQIMEEALREMLRENSPSDADNYTTPWGTDLPDLARCIIRKYNDHFSVVDAANRLSFTLHRISDGKGNLSANIEPRQYMDMYSYGVYLIESLKQVAGNCDDLTTYEESLKKLLFDIQNANQDCCNNDTFLDRLDQSIVNIAETDLEKPPEPLVPAISNVEKYSLQRQFSTLTPAMESNFFSCLSLTRKSSEKSLNTPNSTPNSARIAPTGISSPKTPIKTTLPNINAGVAKEASSNVDIHTENEDDKKTTDAKEASASTDVKIVRKFVNIPQLEEKLDKMQYNNYDIDYDYYNDMDYEYYDEYELERERYGEEAEYEEKEHILEAEGKNASTDSEIFINDLCGEIMRPIGLVKDLCSKMVEDLKNSRKPSPQMQANLQHSFSLMINLKNTLKSIIDSDLTEHENNIRGLLKKVDLHAYIPDKELYVNTIKECLKQIDTYHQVATRVMANCKQQVT